MFAVYWTVPATGEKYIDIVDTLQDAQIRAHEVLTKKNEVVIFDYDSATRQFLKFREF